MEEMILLTKMCGLVAFLGLDTAAAVLSRGLGKHSPSHNQSTSCAHAVTTVTRVDPEMMLVLHWVPVTGTQSHLDGLHSCFLVAIPPKLGLRGLTGIPEYITMFDTH